MSTNLCRVVVGVAVATMIEYSNEDGILRSGCRRLLIIITPAEATLCFVMWVQLASAQSMKNRWIKDH